MSYNAAITRGGSQALSREDVGTLKSKTSKKSKVKKLNKFKTKGRRK